MWSNGSGWECNDVIYSTPKLLRLSPGILQMVLWALNVQWDLESCLLMRLFGSVWKCPYNARQYKVFEAERENCDILFGSTFTGSEELSVSFPARVVAFLNAALSAAQSADEWSRAPFGGLCGVNGGPTTKDLTEIFRQTNWKVYRSYSFSHDRVQFKSNVDWQV